MKYINTSTIHERLADAKQIAKQQLLLESLPASELTAAGKLILESVTLLLNTEECDIDTALNKLGQAMGHVANELLLAHPNVDTITFFFGVETCHNNLPTD